MANILQTRFSNEFYQYEYLEEGPKSMVDAQYIFIIRKILH